MANTFLTPCAACNRHIRADERRCPFCDADVRDQLRRAAAPAPIPAARVGRASAFLFRATALAGITASASVACAAEDNAAQRTGSSSTADAQTEDVASQTPSDGAPQQIDALPDVRDEPVQDVFSGGDAYGVAPDVIAADAYEVAPDVAADAYGVAPDASDAADVPDAGEAD